MKNFWNNFKKELKLQWTDLDNRNHNIQIIILCWGFGLIGSTGLSWKLGIGIMLILIAERIKTNYEIEKMFPKHYALWDCEFKDEEKTKYILDHKMNTTNMLVQVSNYENYNIPHALQFLNNNQIEFTFEKPQTTGGTPIVTLRR